MVYCLYEADVHGTFHDTDPSQMTPEAWMICHHPVYHGDDDSVAVKALKPWHKWNHRPNRVSISSHITTIPVTLPIFQQPYPRQRQKISGSNRCIKGTFFPEPIFLSTFSCFSNLLIVRKIVGILNPSSLNWSTLMLLFGFSGQNFTIKFRRCNSESDILTD
jgi:hypothetical protein